MKYLIILSLFALTSCNQQEQPTPSKMEVEHVRSDEIILDGGKKWKVDKNMLQFIRNMEEDVNTYSEGVDDAAVLAKSLKSNLDKLTSNCTMTGQAHDELHKWLIPYMNTVDDFKKADDEEESQSAYRSLQAAFVEFNTYFE